jgi:uncharacterized protein YndB with AHSA1/START domain
VTDSSIPDVPVVTDGDVFITRMFAAPRDVVWGFFTDPAKLATWFGPAEVHVDPSSVEIDLRPGGRWNLTMVDTTTGARYPLESTLRVVIPGEYLEGGVDSAADGEVQGVTLRLWFHDHGDRTRLTLHQGPFPVQFRDQTGAGWLDSFDKIDAQLDGHASP